MKKNRLREESFMWTKDQIKTVIKLWESKTKAEIADEIGCKEDRVNYISSQIRKAGYHLPKKSKVGYLRGLINDVIREVKGK